MHDDWHQQHYQISSAVQRHHVTQLEPLLPTLKDLNLGKNDLTNRNNNHDLNQSWNRLMESNLDACKGTKRGNMGYCICILTWSLIVRTSFNWMATRYHCNHCISTIIKSRIGKVWTFPIVAREYYVMLVLKGYAMIYCSYNIFSWTSHVTNREQHQKLDCNGWQHG